jgi:hypothetical protein
MGHAHAIELLYDDEPGSTGAKHAVPSAFAAATDPRSEGAPAVW